MTGRLRRGMALVSDLLLIALAICAIFAYFEFGWLRYGRYMNPHDVYHYYMGAKYSQEHEYFHLYRCTLVADAELGKRYRSPTIRNLETHSYESVASILQRKEEYKALFSTERWQEFKKDTAYWRSIMPGYKWNALLRDKGYNATPVWNAVARFLTNKVPTDDVWGMRLLTYIDPILLLLAFGFVWRAFGWRVMSMAIIFHGTNYFMAFVHIKGAFMRLDWLAMLVMSVCLVKLRHYKTAGAAMAVAASSRVFPLIFIVGLGAKCFLGGATWAWNRIRRNPVSPPFDWRYVRFFVMLTGALILFFLLTAYADGGFHLWRNFASKIAVHDSDISTTRVGFKYIFLHDVANKAAHFDQHSHIWWAVIGAALAVTGLLARRVEDYETIPLGFVPVFFISAPTFYYFVMLLLPLFFFLPKVARTSRAIGIAAFFCLSATAYILGFQMPHHFEFFYRCSLGILGLCIYTAYCTLLPKREMLLGPKTLELAGMQSIIKSTSISASPQDRTSRTGLLSFVRGFLAAILVGGTALAAAYWYTSQRDGSAASLGTPQAELVFVGDIMLSRNVERSIKARNQDFRFPFHLTAELIQTADIAFANLECPISEGGVRIEKRYTFRAPLGAVTGLQFAGFDVISLANNHTLDYGAAALDDTLRILDGERITAVGVISSGRPQAPAILEANGIKIGYLAYADTSTPYAYAKEFLEFEQRPAEGTREAIYRDIVALRPRVDILVVSMHWGIEYVSQPDAKQIELGRFIVDSGADIVAGHHPHVQQDAEVYKNKLIIYSMGNFVFDQHSRPLTRESRIYRISVDRTGLRRVEFVPCEIVKDLWQPKPMSEAAVFVWDRSIPQTNQSQVTRISRGSA